MVTMGIVDALARTIKTQVMIKTSQAILNHLAFIQPRKAMRTRHCAITSIAPLTPRDGFASAMNTDEMALMDALFLVDGSAALFVVKSFGCQRLPHLIYVQPQFARSEPGTLDLFVLLA